LSPQRDEQKKKKQQYSKKRNLCMQVHFHLPYTNSLNLYQSISINQYQYQSLSPLPVVLPKLDHQTRAAAAAAQKTTPKKGGKNPQPNGQDSDLARMSLARLYSPLITV